MISVRRAAKELCSLSNWSITNLKLQKMLYIAHRVSLGRYNQPLIDEEFEAWDYGPVLSSLYHDVKMFGNKPIKNIFFNIKDDTEDKYERELSLLNETYENLKTKSAASLVEQTHDSISAWSEFYTLGRRDTKIPNTSIEKEYNARQK